MSRWCLLSLAALCGCTRNHMVGAIDGLQWPVGEAYFVVDEGAYVHYVEGCTAPIYKSDSLHAAVVEIIVK